MAGKRADDARACRRTADRETGRHAGMKNCELVFGYLALLLLMMLLLLLLLYVCVRARVPRHGCIRCGHCRG
jgi:hypothetical protein